LLEVVTSIIEKYGYIAVALGVMIESSGIPFPGETILLAAAVYAANSHLSIGWVIFAAALGAILGDNIGYWVGREYGRKLLAKHGRRFGFTPERQQKIERYFHKYGSFTVFFGRFIALLRAYAAFFAGLNNLHYYSFLLFNALGGIVWAVSIGLLGYFFGSNLPLLEKIISSFGYGLLAITVIGGIGLYFGWRWHKNHPKDKTPNH
jgi:membrane protein DedA with SNARE-associated domain